MAEAKEFVVVLAETVLPSHRSFMWFGFGVLALLALVQLIRIVADRKAKIGAGFLRLYGFLTIATLGMVLVFVNTDEATKAPAYTLLGTIAGYLAGTRPADNYGSGTTADEKGDGGSGGNRSALQDASI